MKWLKQISYRKKAIRHQNRNNLKFQTAYQTILANRTSYGNKTWAVTLKTCLDTIRQITIVRGDMIVLTIPGLGLLSKTFKLY